MQAIQLKELKKIALLGAGAFGQVFLVKHNTKYYALKCLSKALVLETGLQVLPCITLSQSFQSPWIKIFWCQCPFCLYVIVLHKFRIIADNSRSNCSRVCLSVCLSLCLSGWLSVCLSVCLSVWYVHSPVCLTVVYFSLCNRQTIRHSTWPRTPQLTHPGTCEAGEGDSGGVQQLLHGEPGGKLQGQRIPVHAAGVHHGRRALHLSAGQF